MPLLPAVAGVLVARCRALAVRLWADGDRLRYDAPQGVLDDGLRAALAEHKSAVLALLAGGEPPAAGTGPLDHLRGPRRTPWGTLAWSDPAVPPLDLFGPPPQAETEEARP